MSVNITVNGKFAKHCRTHSLLDDPQQVRKHEEQERRKLRLLQVREESKKLAKKIRDEVNEEKKRELQKLQATKEQELECWRQHALQRKEKDYRSAIFEIGTAHRAAQKENQQQAEKQKTQGTYKDFKKQMAAKKTNQGKVQFNADKNCKCKQTRICPLTQYKCICTQTEKSDKYDDEPHKRKRESCFSSSESECEDEGYKEQTLPQSSLSTTSSSFDSTLYSLGNNRATQTSMFVPTNPQNLSKTPAVFLDVEVGTDDSVTITAPAEIHDKHAEYNRQFSSIIRVSPRKGRKTKDNRSDNPQIKQSTTTTTSSTTQSYEITEKDLEKSPEQHPQQTNFQRTKEKHFTLITDLVRKQQDQPPPEISTPTIPSRPPASKATSETVTPQLSPRKQVKTTISRPPIVRPTSLSPRKASASSKSSKAVTEKSHPNSTATASANTGVPSASSSLGRVQFYDYNSKLSRDRAHSQTTAKVQRQQDCTQPTAMEQATLENLRDRERQQELYEKNKQSEERGQKALEREQVRRDCNELTEKLEALTREYPKQLPSENQPHLFADKQLRKEGKMNTAVEKLLNRPNIITCSELNKYNTNNENTKTTDNLRAFYNELNVGASNNALPADDVSSDSCCSILLGYVDDQSRLVRQDLKQWSNDKDNDTNQKQKRLKNLLKRLDSLRNSLMQELKTESESRKEKTGVEKIKFSSNEENLRQVIDSISEMRKEREQILVNEIAKEPKPIRDREKELQAKEAILEEKVKEFYELQKQQNKAQNELRQVKDKAKEVSGSCPNKDVKEVVNTEDNKENVICSSKENPLEIIITVRGESQCIKIPQKPKRKILARKSPSKLASLIRSPQTKGSIVAKRKTPKQNGSAAKPVLQQGGLRRQNSYDSNSTSYMSLPPQLTTKIDDLAERITNERKYTTPISSKQMQTGDSERLANDKQQCSEQEYESSSDPLYDTRGYQPPARINPLIAQYVQRLLGMSRNAVHKLGVSSSDIETPGSTIINTSNNVTSSEAMLSDERLINIHNFVEENKSFIKDLEQSIRSQTNDTLENSLKVIEEIWRQRLRNQNTGKESSKEKSLPKKNKNSQQNSKTPQTSTNREENTRRAQNELPANRSSKEDIDIQKKSSIDKEKEARIKELLEIISNSSKKSDKEDAKEEKITTSSSYKNQKKSSANKNNKEMEKSLSSQYSTDDKETPKPIKKRTRAVEKVDKAIESRLSPESNKAESDVQIARYAKLTENCTHRIAELTELINRVREEKQRLLEVTLSSVSDNGRQSTEYLELPDGKSSTRQDQEDLTRISSSSEETTQNKQTLSTDIEMPKLSNSDKNKQITASRDSGIAESRPITAQDNRLDQEPISQSSSETVIPQPQRKMKPPPTIKRFSPQLPDDDLAHELSTILEVDTPATSRINTAVGQSAEERLNVTESEFEQPKKFPTFEQYVNQLDLDLTQLDSEQSMQLQQEFNSYLEYLKQQQTPANPTKYNEFPSLNAYIENLFEGGGHGLSIEESLTQLRISNIQPQYFPAVKDYLKRNASKTSGEEQQLIDTESLENITEEPANTDSDSMDIEKELKKRKVIKNSFRCVETKQKIFSSTANRGDAAFYQEIIAAESGVDKLSTSDNTIAILESDLKRMVHQWPGQVRAKSQQYHVLSTTTTSANTSDLANSALKAASMDDSSKDTGRPLNLRDFLTRELLKHANISASTTSSSSDESLRSHFLHSIIGSLTPRTNGAVSKSGAQTLDRQKTSTPVPMHSTQTHSSTSSSYSNTSSVQLFSGESRLSSVHYHDRSVRFFTSDGDKADQSSE